LPNVHKDFHGCFSFGLKFLLENYGPAEMEEYLRRLARSVYAPLIESLRSRGLPALEDHWRNVMSIEEADFELSLNDGTLVLEVRECPAITHMRARGYEVCSRFCEATRIVNDEICRLAGFHSETEYDQENARCIQRFRKEACG
jgi:hypothetical protein